MQNGNERMDERLSTASQEAMREVVRSLPEESVSMAWRSSLNEQILAVAAQNKRRQRFVWMMRPAAALALTGALAVMIVLRSPIAAPPAKTAAVEAALVSAHDQVASFSDVTTVGLSPVEVAYGTTRIPTGFDYDEVDVDSL